MLELLLDPLDIGVELGSGRSTVWLAQRLAHLYSMEHQEEWHVRVSGWLDHLELGGRVSYTLVGPDEATYVAACDQFADDSIDFCLVDGIHRGKAALCMATKIKPGGMLVVDDIERYLPDAVTRSPSARSMWAGPLDATWGQFAERVADWRSLRTSDGVSDTAIWIRR